MRMDSGINGDAQRIEQMEAAILRKIREYPKVCVNLQTDVR